MTNYTNLTQLHTIQNFLLFFVELRIIQILCSIVIEIFMTRRFSSPVIAVIIEWLKTHRVHQKLFQTKTKRQPRVERLLVKLNSHSTLVSNDIKHLTPTIFRKGSTFHNFLSREGP